MDRKWSEKYIKYLDNENMTYIDIGEKMEQYRPLELYRYMRFDEYWEKNIFEGQLYLSCASELNDPFDCLVYLDHEKYKKDIFEKTRRMFPSIYENILQEEIDRMISDEMDQLLYEMKKEYRITCFSEYNLSPLMWAHYADSHKGFCLKYDLSKIDPGYCRAILPVIYTDKRYDASEAFITRKNNLSMNFCFFKSLHWKYEKEWRIAIPGNIVRDGEYYADFSAGISGIYIGLNSMKNHGDKVKEIVKQYSIKGIPVHEMYIEHNTYNLKSKIIN